MEIKVKEVGVIEEKSAIEVEETLLESAEQQHEAESQQEVVDNSTSQEETQSTELKEEDVLSFIKNRYDKDISSVGQLFDEKRKQRTIT